MEEEEEKKPLDGAVKNVFNEETIKENLQKAVEYLKKVKKFPQIMFGTLHGSIGTIL